MYCIGWYFNFQGTPKIQLLICPHSVTPTLTVNKVSWLKTSSNIFIRTSQNDTKSLSYCFSQKSSLGWILNKAEWVIVCYMNPEINNWTVSQWSLGDVNEQAHKMLDVGFRTSIRLITQIVLPHLKKIEHFAIWSRVMPLFGPTEK